MFCFCSFFILLHVLALQVGFLRAFTINVPETVQGVALLTWTRTADDSDTWALNLTDVQSKISLTLPGRQSTPFDLTGQLEVPIPETGRFILSAISPTQPSFFFAQSQVFLSLPVDSSISVDGSPTPSSSTVLPSETSSDDPQTTPSTSPSPSPSPNANLESPTRNAIIAGSVIAAVIFILLVVAGTILFTRSRNPGAINRMSFYRDRMVRTPKGAEAGFDLPPNQSSTAHLVRA